jgi:thiamine pyrophosphate-dependent acetolactate synthase large subunit-like protein
MDAFRESEDVVQRSADTPSTSEHLAVADSVVALLKGLGVRHAFGVSGAAMASLWRAMSMQLDTVHFRHEAGAAFAAAEAYFATGRPVMVFTTTGPGITNALTGIIAGRGDGAKVILISAYTPAPHRGRWSIQETSGQTFPVDGLFTSGVLMDYACIVEHPGQLPQIMRRVAHGLASKGGFVAHLCLPSNVQRLPGVPISKPTLQVAKDLPSEELVEQCIHTLRDGSFAIWVGFGAREAAAPIRALAERTGASVMCSPRGKGIFPEEHPQFVGVTGLAGHASVFEYMAREKPERILVLGTRLGEPTSFWNRALVPPRGFIHVDINPNVPGVAYPDVETLAVRADVSAFVESLVMRLPVRRPVEKIRSLVRPDWSSCPTGRSERVRPEALMIAIQRRIVYSSDAIVMAESGNSFTWATRMLRFSDPGRFRVSTGVGAMGHMSTGVVGAALATRKKAVAIVGDGAMLMNNEINTAAKHKVPAVWVVLNDGRYNMCFQGLAMLQMTGPDATFPMTDFVLIAKGMGAKAIRVSSEAELDAALDQAMAASGPFVVDVQIDPERVAPSGARNRGLIAPAN